MAKGPGPVAEGQLRLMLRTLLAERFHLAVHRERREMPVTALLVDKGGPKFHESAGKYQPELGAEAPMQFLGYGNNVHIQRSQDSGGRLRDSYANVPMTLFAAVLELMGSRTPWDKLMRRASMLQMSLIGKAIFIKFSPPVATRPIR